MTREEAARIIKECKEKGFKHTFYTLNEYYTALDTAIKALEQEPCEDCISRQAVIDKIFESRMNFYNEFDQGFFADKIRELPPVNPQPKTGHWIALSPTDMYCSECNEIETLGFYRKYCAFCGAKMVESENQQEP